jgi:CubicO group peptidase (beta-lactamase class C family)
VNLAFPRLATLAAALGLVANSSTALAQSFPADPRVDRLFAQWDTPDSPGCALGVVRDGKFVYQRGYGMANLDYDIPNAPQLVYYVGSDSKQFTAAAIGLLALQGKLSIDDDIRK